MNARLGIISGRLENTVDATRGQPLAERVLARKNELEDALADSAAGRNRRCLEIRLGDLRRHSLGMPVKGSLTRELYALRDQLGSSAAPPSQGNQQQA